MTMTRTGRRKRRYPTHAANIGTSFQGEAAVGLWGWWWFRIEPVRGPRWVSPMRADMTTARSAAAFTAHLPTRMATPRGIAKSAAPNQPRLRGNGAADSSATGAHPGEAPGGAENRAAPSWLFPAARLVRAELSTLAGPPASRLRARGWRALPVTTGLLVLMLIFVAVPTGGTVGSVVRSISAVSADLPWWQAALRLPASILVPASNLPTWGAFVQVAVIAAVAESVIGWRRMLLVAIMANAAATAGAQMMALLGTHRPLGINADIACQPDTGPSVFVTATLIFLAIVHRTPIVGCLTALIMTAEVVINPNLAGREHLIGMATATAVAAIYCHQAGRAEGPGSPVAIGGSRPPKPTLS